MGKTFLSDLKSGTKLYKKLDDGKAYGGFVWSLPTEQDGTWIPGNWHEVEGQLIQCRWGLHLTSDPARRFGVDTIQELYEAEVEGPVVDCGEEIVARKVRLLRRVSDAEMVTMGVWERRGPAPAVPLCVALDDGRQREVDFRKSLPVTRRGKTTPGAWVTTKIIGRHRAGITVCLDPKSVYRQGSTRLYEAEVEGDVIGPSKEAADHIIAGKVRLLREVDRPALVKLGLESPLIDPGTYETYYALDVNCESKRTSKPTRRAGGWRAGAWVKSTDRLHDHSGFMLHIDLKGVRARHSWEAPTVYVAEARGDMLRQRGESEIVRAAEIRLLRPLSWSEMKRLGIVKGRKIVVSGDSPVVSAVKFLARQAARGTSDRDRGYGVRAAILTCAKNRVPFTLGDFVAIEKDKNLADWHGAGGIEWMYRDLIREKHESAIRAFETWIGRKPFVVQGRRLTVGDTFWWATGKRKKGRAEGNMFKVTSFDDGKHTMNACTHRHEEKPDPYNRGEERYRWMNSTRRYTFSQETIAEAERTRVLTKKRAKESEKLQQSLRYDHKNHRNIELSTDQIFAWTDEQRAAAWTFVKTERGWNDPPTPVPEFIVEAEAARRCFEERARVKSDLQTRKFKAGGTGKKYDFQVKVTEAEIDAEIQRREATKAA